MSIDNRVLINDCENSNNFATDGGSQLGNTSTAGFFYENTNGIEVQHTNADNATYAINNSAGTALNLNLTGTTVYLIAKDNLTETEANNGVQIVLGDGTRRYGYTVGGSDGGGIALSGYWKGYKLDTSNISLTTPDVTFAGTGTLAIAAITEVGFGSLHISKARGNITNLFLDYIAYDANTDYHLTINGGTAVTAETFSDVAADDVTASTATPPWGIVSEPITGSFSVFTSTEWGDTGTADSYFETSNESIFLLGETIASGNFLFRVVGNTTGTNSFAASNTSFTGVTRATGSRAIFDWSDANVDILTLNNCSFINIGTQTFGAQDASKTVSGCTYTSCDQIDFDTTNVTGCTFNGSNNANGVVLLNASGNSATQTNLTFNAEVPGTPSGHAVEINTNGGTYTFTNWNFTSGDFSTGTDANGGSTGDTNAAVYCSGTTGTVTINVVGGTTPSVYAPNGVTVTIVNNITVTVSGLLGNTELKVLPTAGSPYSGNTLGTEIISTETISADTNVGDGTNYISYSNVGGFVQINAVGTATFTNFPGILQDTNSTVPRALADGDTIRVTIRDDTDNSTLQLFDQFIVDADPTAPTSSAILTKTSFATFTSAFGTVLNSANSKTVTVEKEKSRFQFDVASGTSIDFLSYRIGSDPILTTGATITADTKDFPLSQVGDRNYSNPA